MATLNVLKTSAVGAMQKYLSSVDRAPLRSQQRLYNRVSQLIEKLAREAGMDMSSVWGQVEQEARRIGIPVGLPGKDW